MTIENRLAPLAPSAPSRAPARELEDDPTWYERAVFYEISPRGFYDSNGDGTGDLPGVIAKLDYLSWLGIDCIWLMPFYPSPLRDGGYDVSEYCAVAPELGDLEDLSRLVKEAHDRGIRVITDLVLQHTSDQHPWFIESRSSRDNPKADWYIWSDDNQSWRRHPRRLFRHRDFELDLDATRQQYYWHRFFHHQPDLNLFNPEVQEALMSVVRFWLDLGVDGFRLDAAAYLFQRDGIGENRPETHVFSGVFCDQRSIATTRIGCFSPR